MNKYFLVLVILLLSLNSKAQITFEKAYYIDNNDNKVECFIKNKEWKNNPTKFEYRLSEKDEAKTATIETVKEFGIANTFKYLRRTVNIDRSDAEINKLDHNRFPDFSTEELFLKVLIEGKASLYCYEDGDLRRYFYTKNNGDIEQLIRKEYLNKNNGISTNNGFRQQLWLELNHPSLSQTTFERLDYNQKELSKLFTNYNAKHNSEHTNFNSKQKKDLFNLSIRPGINRSSFTINNNIANSRNINFGNKTGFRLGIEAEMLLPFNKNKWAIIIEPTYQYYQAEHETKYDNLEVDYSSIELPIGLRHYFYLNKHAKLFINGAFVFDFANNSSINTEYASDIDIKSNLNFAIGGGYKFKDRYSIELRYFTKRDLLRNYVHYRSDYQTYSVVFGYSLF